MLCGSAGLLVQCSYVYVTATRHSMALALVSSMCLARCGVCLARIRTFQNCPKSACQFHALGRGKLWWVNCTIQTLQPSSAIHRKKLGGTCDTVSWRERSHSVIQLCVRFRNTQLSLREFHFKLRLVFLRFACFQVTPSDPGE